MAASFPSSIKSYTPKNPLDIIPSSEWNSFQEEIIAIETNLITGPQVISATTAWQQIPGNPTWTYASATTFTITGNVSGFFPVGTKIRLTQTTIKYFYVVSASYSSPNTTITVTGGSDYSLAAASITNPLLSYALVTQGFPQWFNWTPTIAGLGGMTIGSLSINRNLFSMIGKTIFIECHATFTTGGTASPTVTFTLPFTIGTALGTLACYVNSSGSIAGWTYVLDAATIGIRKYDASNWSLAAGNYFRVSGTVIA